MKPKPLIPGDMIQFVTPASPIASEKLEVAFRLLNEAGYRTKLSPNALLADGYLAGSDRERADDFQAAFDDEETAAVMCTRGGYGCSRMLPFLDVGRIANSGKLLIGFSDVTTLHLALNRLGTPTVHAPMALTLHYAREPWVYDSLFRVLRGDLEIPESAPGGKTVVDGVAEGTLVGGCMCLLTDSIGTPWALETDDKLLLIEDVGESPHRVDAMLTHLLNSGLASKAAGFVIGEMTRTEEHVDGDIGERPWRDIVRERLAPLGKPMMIDFPVGHAKNMLSVPLGIRARLDAGAGRLTYLEGLCS